MGSRWWLAWNQGYQGWIGLLDGEELVYKAKLPVEGHTLHVSLESGGGELLAGVVTRHDRQGQINGLVHAVSLDGSGQVQWTRILAEVAGDSPTAAWTPQGWWMGWMGPPWAGEVVRLGQEGNTIRALTASTLVLLAGIALAGDSVSVTYTGISSYKNMYVYKDGSSIGYASVGTMGMTIDGESVYGYCASTSTTTSRGVTPTTPSSSPTTTSHPGVRSPGSSRTTAAPPTTSRRPCGSSSTPPMA